MFKKVLFIYSMIVIFIAGVGSINAQQTDLIIKISNCPQSAKAGQELGSSFKVVATNRGNIEVKEVAVDIVLKKDTSCPTPTPVAVYSPNFSDGVLLKGGREHVSLKPGQTLNVKLNGTNTIPADIPSGSYYLCAVIDAGDKVKEADEKNNCSCCPLKIVGEKPDLTIPSVKFEKVKSLVDSQGQPYWIFNVIITVKNQGTGAAGPFKILLERNIGPGGTYTIACMTCEIDVSGLTAGQTLTLPPRQFNNANKMNSLFRATADSKNTIVESNEANNMNAEGFTP